MSQKNQYALRAIFELAKHYGQGPVKISLIAKEQSIPPRFLEAILGQLKQAKFVDSIRGSQGGYLLLRPPAELSVGEVLRFLGSPIEPVDCFTSNPKTKCGLRGHCVFLPMWDKARKALLDVYDNTSFQDLIDSETCKASGDVSYSI
ncbi:MAG TPA: Rrf2 family transcriptional regulator [Planctomycetota bacterium]|nr:Rrf2 family transcriptional regulator [Planctomycetota bacterium]